MDKLKWEPNDFDGSLDQAIITIEEARSQDPLRYSAVHDTIFLPMHVYLSNEVQKMSLFQRFALFADETQLPLVYKLPSQTQINTVSISFPSSFLGIDSSITNGVSFTQIASFSQFALKLKTPALLDITRLRTTHSLEEFQIRNNILRIDFYTVSKRTPFLTSEISNGASASV